MVASSHICEVLVYGENMVLVRIFRETCIIWCIAAWHPALTPGMFAAKDIPCEWWSIDIHKARIDTIYRSLASRGISGGKVRNIGFVILVVCYPGMRINEVVEVAYKSRFCGIDAIVIRSLRRQELYCKEEDGEYFFHWNQTLGFSEDNCFPPSIVSGIS
jgi:hypothetical protein